MENINKKNNSFVEEDFFKVSKIFLFSLMGIVIFFIPIKLNNQYETIIYHISYYIENKISIVIDITVILFIILSTIKDLLAKEKTFVNVFYLIIKIFGLVILFSILFEVEDLFFISNEFNVVMRDTILNLTILLPVSAVFMPLILDYGLIEIVEAYTHRFTKRLFKVSGKIFLNFLIYLSLDSFCGAFLTYRLYKDGKLREREACIVILNFSILSFSLTSDLCNKLDINLFKFMMIEIFVLCICNIIISRIYPLKNKRQSYYYKSGYKDVNCRKNKLNTAIKKHISRGNKKNLISYSLSYLNDALYIIANLIPNIVVIFFIGNIIFNCESTASIINNLTYMIISLFDFPNEYLMANVINLSFFNNILGIKRISSDIFYPTKVMLSLIIVIQGISISILIPFIKKTIIPLTLREILIVSMERMIIILLLSFIGYYFYIGYIL